MPIRRKINICLVFAGNHAIKNILPVLTLSPYYNLIGIYFRKRKYDKNKFSKYKIYKTYKEALFDEEVDCVYISSPNNSHFKISLEALNNRKHVICEKPITTNLRDFKKLVKISEFVNRYFFEAFMFQYHNQYKILNKLLMKKQSGKILTLNARFGYPHLNKDNIRYNKKLNGGSFFDIACYLIKLTYLLLGNNYKNISGNFNFEKKYSVDISGNVLINFKSKQTAFLDWGIGRCYVNQVDIWTENYRIIAERFFSKPENLNTQIKKIDSKGKITFVKVNKMNHFRAMFEEYHNIINKKKFTKYLNSMKDYQNFYFKVHKTLIKK